MHPSQTAFTALMCRTALQHPDWPTFDADYEGVLDAVHHGGNFDFHGLQIMAPPGIYPPRQGGSTCLMADHWNAQGLLNTPGRMLELGCGAGGLSLLAQKFDWDVLACDVDIRAVEASRANARANGLQLNVFHSDLFSAVPAEKFDAVVFNLPLYHKPTAEQRETTLADQDGGIAERFLAEVPQFLRDDGCILFTFSNCSRGDLLDNPSWKFEILGCDYFSRGRYWRAVIKGTLR